MQQHQQQQQNNHLLSVNNICANNVYYDRQPAIESTSNNVRSSSPPNCKISLSLPPPPNYNLAQLMPPSLTISSNNITPSTPPNNNNSNNCSSSNTVNNNNNNITSNNLYTPHYNSNSHSNTHCGLSGASSYLHSRAAQGTHSHNNSPVSRLVPRLSVGASDPPSRKQSIISRLSIASSIKRAFSTSSILEAPPRLVTTSGKRNIGIINVPFSTRQLNNAFRYMVNVHWAIQMCLIGGKLVTQTVLSPRHTPKLGSI